MYPHSEFNSSASEDVKVTFDDLFQKPLDIDGSCGVSIELSYRLRYRLRVEAVSLLEVPRDSSPE